MPTATAIALNALKREPLAACLDLFDPRLRQDPYPQYASLRERGQVHVAGDCNGDVPAPAWVFGHRAASMLLTDSRIQRQEASTQPSQPQGPYARMISNWMLFQDAPSHTRQRASLGCVFTPPTVAAMRTNIEGMVERRVNALIRRRSVDLIRDFAFPLPVQVIASLLGLPEHDCGHFKRWSTALSDAIDLRPSASALKAADDAVTELQLYFRRHAQMRRRKPTSDLLTTLLAQSDIDDGLTEEEVFATFTLLITAGHETATNLIGNGMLALLSNPDQAQRLRDQPELIRSAIEEFLRYNSPVQITSRIVSSHLEIDGHVLQPRQRVLIVIGSANRDPDVFTNPDQVDVGRKPNPHLTFGMGSHYCAGAPLARLQAAIAIDALINRLPDLQLSSESQTWRANASFRGLLHLPCRLQALSVRTA